MIYDLALNISKNPTNPRPPPAAQVTEYRCRATESQGEQPTVITPDETCIPIRRRPCSNTPKLLEYAEGAVRNTPKALANFSPGLERSDNPGYRATFPVKP